MESGKHVKCSTQYTAKSAENQINQDFCIDIHSTKVYSVQINKKRKKKT